MTFIFGLIALALATSCEIEEEIKKPSACFTITKFNANISGEEVIVSAKVGEEIIFTSCSLASHLALWPGDKTFKADNTIETTRDYNDYINPSPESGIPQGLTIIVPSNPQKKPVLKYTYKTAGTYTITLIATNISEKAEKVERTISTQIIEIKP